MPSYSRSTSRDRERYRSSRKKKRSRSRDNSSERRHKRSCHKERKKTRSRSPSRDHIYAPSDVALELGGGTDINMAQLDKKTVEWLQERINEQVMSRIGDIEEIVRERVKSAKIDMEKRLKLQIENELKQEMEAIRRREKESKERCAALEKALEEKMKAFEESECKLTTERLQMLEAKRCYEEERAKLECEKDALKKNEQQSILNKGGTMRAPIRMKLGK